MNPRGAVRPLVLLLGGALGVSCGAQAGTEERDALSGSVVELAGGARTAPEGFGNFVAAIGCEPDTSCTGADARWVALLEDEMTTGEVCDSFVRWAAQSIAKDVMFAGAGEAEGSTVPFAVGKRDDLVVSCVEALDGGGYVTATGMLHNRGEMVAGSSFEATLGGDTFVGHAGVVFSLKIDRPGPES